ncbi:MAG: helix-turn-helix transcriptional regulator [Chloroflexi bacterium]|nr:MAG: helix-turn-helix transcriptional regulator [Chloroflexota bacterium]
MPDETMGDRIRKRRMELGMSLAKVAGGDFSRAYLHQVELGKTQPSTRILRVVADRLGSRVEYLLDGSMPTLDREMPDDGRGPDGPRARAAGRRVAGERGRADPGPRRPLPAAPFARHPKRPALPPQCCRVAGTSGQSGAGGTSQRRPRVLPDRARPAHRPCPKV